MEVKTKKTFLAVDKACMAIFRPTSGFKLIKGKTFISFGFSTVGTIISACAVPHCRRQRTGRRRVSSFKR